VRAIGRQSQRAPDGAPVHYERHCPEQTTRYRLAQQHAASFIAHTEASTGAELPRFIQDEFDAFPRMRHPGTAIGAAALLSTVLRGARRLELVYGGFAGIVSTLVFLYVSAATLIFAAEINAALRRVGRGSA
jgi:hypothetical protein